MAAKAGRLQIQLEMQVAELRRDLAAIRTDIAKESAGWKRALSDVGVGFKEAFTFAAVDTAITGVVAGIQNAARELLTTFDTIADGALRIGVTTEEYQKLGFAFQLAGSNAEAMEGVILKMQKTLGDGSKATRAAIKELGLSFEDIRGQNPADQLRSIIEALAEVEDPAKRAALGASVLGRGWAEAGVLIGEGAEETRKLMEAADRLGVVLSDNTVQAGARFNDQLDIMKLQGKALLADFMGPILDGFARLGEEFDDTTTKAGETGKAMEFLRRTSRALGQIVAATIDIFAAQVKINGIWATTLIQNARDVFAVYNKAFDAFTTINPIERVQKSLEVLTTAVDSGGKMWDRMTSAANATLKISGDVLDVLGQIGVAEQELASTPPPRVTGLGGEGEDDPEAKTKKTTAAVKELGKSWLDASVYADRITKMQLEANAAVTKATEEQAKAWREFGQDWQDEQNPLAVIERQLKEIRELAASGYLTPEEAENATKALRDQLDKTATVGEIAADTLERGALNVAQAFTESSRDGVEALKQLVAQMLIAIATAKLLQAFGIGGGNTGYQAAKGGWFQGTQAQFFAQGGVVSGPTAFSFAGGKMGVMGEAGPEAIMPLERTSGGKLGVRATGTPAVQVFNYGAQVETDTSGDQLKIIINTVRDSLAGDIATGGNPFAGAFERTYGVRR